jgi:DNA-binding protein YbaB
VLAHDADRPGLLASGAVADDLGRATDAVDRLLAETARTLESMRAAGSPAADGEPVRGTGTAADERIQAVATAANRIDSIRLDPRLMRLGSEDLAEEIVKAVNAALADFQAQTQAMSAPVDPEEFAGQLRQLREDSVRGMVSVTSALGEVLGQIRQGRW